MTFTFNQPFPYTYGKTGRPLEMVSSVFILAYITNTKTLYSSPVISLTYFFLGMRLPEFLLYEALSYISCISLKLNEYILIS